MEAPPIIKLLASSCKIAEKAGSIIHRVLGSGKLDVVTKGHNDVTTQADKSAQACIVRSLNIRFPELKCIGEEDLSEDQINNIPAEDIELNDNEHVFSQVCPENLKNLKMEDFIVWVDPLDGTKEFSEGEVEHVTILVGISAKGRPIAGVVHQPYSPPNHVGRTMWALEGVSGVFGLKNESPNEAAILKPKSDLNEENNIICTSKSHSNPLNQTALESVKPSKTIRVGGAGYKVLLLLEGHCHGYIFATPGCKKWDTCAPEALLRASGGRLTDMRGNDLVYREDVPRMNESGVLAANQINWHEKYLSAAGWK